MNCPTCNAQLMLAERYRVEIDTCPQCRGVWLDRGELDKIIEQATRDNARGANEGPYLDDDAPGRIDDGPPHRKRRGSFLEELFDF